MFKKVLKVLTIGLLALTVAITSFVTLDTNKAWAVTRDLYWVEVAGSGTGNWSDTAHWSLSSGGAGGEAAPDVDDNAHFDLNSFKTATGIVTVDAAANCLAMDWTGVTNNPTLAGDTYILNIYGDLTLNANMIVTYSWVFNFVATSPKNIDTKGITTPCAWYFTGSGGTWTLQDDINLTTKRLRWWRGTFNSNDKTITAGITGRYTSDPSSLTLNFGASTINCTNWDWSGTITGLTLSANTSTINASGNFSGGSLTTYNVVNLTGAAPTISGSNTFAELNLPSGTTQTITFTDGTTQTAASFSLSGDATHTHTLQGSGAAGWAITKSGGGYYSFDYLVISRSTASPATTFYAGDHSTDGGNNAGWIFAALVPPTNVTATINQTDKVTISWDAVSGATAYDVFRDGGDISGGYTVAVETYDDSTGDAPTITAGTAAASDGTSTAYVTLTLTGMLGNDGTSYTYTVRATDGTNNTADSAGAAGYRCKSALSYQWQRSAADSDAAFGNIAGATTNPYNDTAGVAGDATATTNIFRGFGLDWIILEGQVGTSAVSGGRYYLCVVSMADAADANSTHDRGYKITTAVTQFGFDYGLTTAYGSDTATTKTLEDGDLFVSTIRSLTAGTLYHFRAKVYDGAWHTGSDLYVSTKGSPVIYEYYNTGGDGDSDAIYGANFTAQQFTVQTTSHTVVKIVIPLKIVGAPGTFYVKIYHATVAAEPTGLEVASGSFNGNLLSAAYLMIPITLDVEVPITGSAKYAIRVSAPDGDGSNYVVWQQDTGGGLANAVGLHSTDAGSTWVSDSPTDYLFEIWGNSCIQVKSGFAYPNYITTGDILFALEGLNIYPPDVNEYTNRPTKSPQTRYLVRLLDTDGITVLASTPLVWYGDAPASIYIGAAQASTLTLGGAYYLEIYGNFTGNPSASYQLLPTDWSGGIAGWVLQTAYSMEAYYSTATTAVDFTEPSVKVGSDVLNEEGGTIFMAGIPYLMETHPELFLTQVIQPSFTAPASQVAPLAGVWQNQVGANISGLFTSIGTMLGISGKYIGTALLLILWLMLPLAVGSRGGTPFVALVLGFPILALGVWLYLIDFVFIASIILVVAVITFIGLWVTRT